MKKSILLAFAVVTALFTGCTEDMPEPTELTTQDLKGSVTIEGYIQYNQKDSDGLTKYVYYEDGKATVNFDVAYADIDSDADGNYRVTAQSDKNGHYSVTIPVKANERVSVTISGSFKADTYGYSTSSNKYVMTEANYKFENTTSVIDGNTYQVDFNAILQGFKDQDIINY